MRATRCRLIVSRPKRTDERGTQIRDSQQAGHSGLRYPPMDIGMIPILARQLTTSADEKVFFSSGKAVGQNVLASWN